MPYDFQHYILISKLYKSDGSKKKKNKVTGQTDPDILFSNAEEEVFDEVSIKDYLGQKRAK